MTIISQLLNVHSIIVKSIAIKLLNNIFQYGLYYSYHISNNIVQYRVYNSNTISMLYCRQLRVKQPIKTIPACTNRHYVQSYVIT